MVAPLFIEMEWLSLNKVGQSICGDAVVAQKFNQQQRHIAVLSDGLGSGVKANILSTMTATMAARFIEANMVTANSLGIMMDALPVCKVRNISYATFTIIDTSLSGQAKVIEMGNPPLLHLRDNKVLEYTSQCVHQPERRGRDIRSFTLDINPGDRLVVVSDGITMAGLGSNEHRLGMRLSGCEDFILQRLADKPDISARELSQDILANALKYEPQGVAHDDMTCMVIYYRKPRRLLLMTGPPFNESHDASWARQLGSFDGNCIVCGGTTANILARELDLEIKTSLKPVGNLPASSQMTGTRLATEGILTLTRVSSLLASGQSETSPAGDIIEEFKNHDIIEFCVGTKINEAHQDPSLPAELDIRRNIIKKIAKILEEKYLKQVQVRYV